jgi:hypothetical protein
MSDMNNELRFLPIPENSRANQLIHYYRRLNQYNGGMKNGTLE